MVRLSSITVGLLWALSRTLSVAAQDDPVVEPPVVDGDSTFGFPSTNITAILAEAETELGINGTVTDNLPVDAGIPGANLTARHIHPLAIRKRGLLNEKILGLLCCTALYIALPGKCGKLGTILFANLNNPSFWSSTTYMTPSCIVRPTSAEDVSLAMRIIVLTGADFNVVGGGHSAIRGWANAEDGVLINMSALNGLRLVGPDGKGKPENVQVGAGQRWGGVYDFLDKRGRMALGGRMATVGVPGLTLGGGISYLTNQYGFVCDQVVNFQVVLYNGCIVNANAKENPDLFRALKGGSSNFGIVTRFDLRTFASTQVYAGQMMFDQSQFPDLFKKIYNYHTSGAIKDKLSHLISAFVSINVGSGTPMQLGAFTVFRDTNIEDPGELKEITKLPTMPMPGGMGNTVKLRTYGSMATELGSNDITGLRQDMRDFSAYACPELYKTLFDKYNNDIVAKLGNIAGFQGTIAFQPITQPAVQAGKDQGGNSLGLEGITKTLVVINLTHQWTDASKDNLIINTLNAFVEECITCTKKMKVDHGFFYLNYASKNKDPLLGYGDASVSRMKAACKKYDPYGIFQISVPGGFKVPGAKAACAKLY
ncbi:hypothetical protein TWF696_001312 [Orbilia brochopaga]|uniref:FAD-binding PCMH-type domain-containing protein n=1 Tax=Orbilia brochopaga TaxID=3140254 RepID=A0AAV9UCP7_9PEZI